MYVLPGDSYCPMLTDFLFIIAASTGGLLGLFMGFSVLSIVEIIYFITMRPYLKKNEIKDHAEKSEVKQVEVARISKDVSKFNIATKIAWMKYDTVGVDDGYIPFPYTE